MVGVEPVLSKEQPAFQYSSHVSLQAPSGHMWSVFNLFLFEEHTLRQNSHFCSEFQFGRKLVFHIFTLKVWILEVYQKIINQFLRKDVNVLMGKLNYCDLTSF